MRKEDKGLIIEQLGEMLKQYPHFYIVDVEGMNAGQTSALRRMCFKNNLKMVVVKNTLLQKALEASEIHNNATNIYKKSMVQIAPIIDNEAKIS